MGPFDDRVLTVLRDGKPRGFHQLLGEAGFSHNTLRPHPERLVDTSLVMKQKMPKKGVARAGSATPCLLDSSARSPSYS